MDGKIWMYLRWDSEFIGSVWSASHDWWGEYFQDYDPLLIAYVEAREVVR